MTPLAWLALAAAGLLVLVGAVRETRRRRMDQLNATWGVQSPREHRMEEIARSHRSRLAALGEPLALDDRTWNDLVLDDVFRRVDHTESTLGRHALYHRLRVAHTLESLPAFEALVTRVSSDVALRVRARLALGRLRDPHGYDLWWLSRPDAVQLPRWYIAFPILTVATLVMIPLVALRPDLFPALLGPLALSFLLNLATVKTINSVSNAFRQIAPLVATAQELAFAHGDDIDAIVAPIRRHTRDLLSLKTIARWISADPLMLSARSNMLAVMLADLASSVYDYVNLVLPLNAAGVYLGVDRLRKNATALLDVVAAIGEVDAALSVASLRAGATGWSRPVFSPLPSAMAITDAVHPLVTDAVPNSLVIQPAAGMLVTGSNMSGKSTFLRTVGVTTVMAQSLHTCFAASYAAPLLTVRSRIGRADDLLAGKSYYLVEVEALLALVRASTSPTPHMFLLDEMFRGTNAVERIAAGQSVLVEFIQHGRPHVVIAATHDTELVDLLTGLYAPCHFGDNLTDETLTFDYRLRSGRATSRNAIALLHLNGAPSALVERALASAADLDRQKAR
ncbi:MAG TPA: hypothetical protein VM846_18520 [Vicinamibacterales bacterium]|nr:hypothetical protein [Vicinamibacterales bacterium]